MYRNGNEHTSHLTLGSEGRFLLLQWGLGKEKEAERHRKARGSDADPAVAGRGAISYFSLLSWLHTPLCRRLGRVCWSSWLACILAAGSWATYFTLLVSTPHLWNWSSSCIHHRGALRINGTMCFWYLVRRKCLKCMHTKVNSCFLLFSSWFLIVA